MVEKLKIVRGSGNVFLDIGFSPDEAQNLHLRSELMCKIDKFSLDAPVNMLGHAGMRVRLLVRKAA